MDGGAFEFLSLEDVRALTQDALLRAGATSSVAAALSQTLETAERDGRRAVGLSTLPSLIEHIRAGRVDPDVEPEATWTNSATLVIDARGGFAEPALDHCLSDLAEKVAQNGIGSVTIRNAYPMILPERTAAQISNHGLATRFEGTGLASEERATGQIGIICQDLQLLGTPAPSGEIHKYVLQENWQIRPYEGPVGGPIAVDHWIMAADDTTLLPASRGLTLAQTPTRLHSDGVSVPTRLLEDIINA